MATSPLNPQLLAAALAGLTCGASLGCSDDGADGTATTESAGGMGTGSTGAGGDGSVGGMGPGAGAGGDGSVGGMGPGAGAGGSADGARGATEGVAGAPAAGGSADDGDDGSAGDGGASYTITSTTIVQLTEAEFRDDCDDLGGTVEVHPVCGGANSCAGKSYDIDTDELTVHGCAGLNTCRGFSCVLGK